MTILYDYLVQFLPILVGTTFMLAVRAFAVKRHRVRLCLDGYNGTAVPASTSSTTEQYDGVGDLAKAKLRKWIYEEGLVNGVVLSGAKTIDAYGSVTLGVIDVTSRQQLVSGKGDNLLFTRNTDAFLAKVLAFDKWSAPVLAQMLDYKLEVLLPNV